MTAESEEWRTYTIPGVWRGPATISIYCDGTPRHVYTTVLDAEGHCELKRPCTEEDHPPVRPTVLCSCKQYGEPCDDECNCCDSPYAIEGCDCTCLRQKIAALIRKARLET